MTKVWEVPVGGGPLLYVATYCPDKIAELSQQDVLTNQMCRPVNVLFLPVDADGNEGEDAAADGEDGDEVSDLAVDGAEGPVARQHVHQVEGHIQRRHHRVRHREVHCKKGERLRCTTTRKIESSVCGTSPMADTKMF